MLGNGDAWYYRCMKITKGLYISYKKKKEKAIDSHFNLLRSLMLPYELFMCLYMYKFFFFYLSCGLYCRFSPFLMACYNPETEEFQSVCRVMSGFSDSFYVEVK